jgi:cyclophilin family peptidyl-prolyl cis-trans isomerase
MVFSMYVRYPVLVILASVVLAGCGFLPQAIVPAEAPTATPTSITVVSGPINQWDSPPDMQIDPDRIYLATFETEKGDITVELFAAQAPMTVNNFIFLAREGFYDNTTFHRVISGFMAQGGDPTATGSGGPGYSFEDEIDESLEFDQAGILAMANAGPDTNGSQFFITYAPTPWLNGAHTIFGRVIEGQEVLDSLTERDPIDSPDFLGDVLLTVQIREALQSALPTPTVTPIPVVPVPEEGRPLAELPVENRAALYTGPPEIAIDINKRYEANVQTTQGSFTIQLEPLSAPKSVNNFVVLSELGYFDGFPISMVQEGSLVLTGSPAGNPESDVGYSLPNEAGSATTRGAVGYWLRPDVIKSSGSQVFILLDDIPGWEADFTVFGYVSRGMEVVDALTLEDTIERIDIRAR